MRTALRILALALSLPALAACEPTEECERLQAAVDEAEEALTKVKLRAVMRDRVERRLESSKAEAEKILGAYGLDRPESELTETFEARAARHDGVSVERTTRKTERGPDINPYAYDTVWRFEISPRPLPELFDVLDDLAASPPVTRLSLFQRRSDGSSALELMRITIPEAPIEPEPAPLPEVPDISEIPAQWGFCGAGRLRSRIEEVRQEIAELEDDANATAVAMPRSVTWRAKGIRAEQKGALERGGRKVFAKVMEVVSEHGLVVRALGIEDEVVIVEIEGDRKRMTRRLEETLPKDLASGLRPLPSPKEDLARFSLPNPAFEQMKPPGAGEGAEGGLGGLPSPEAMRKQLEQMQGREEPAED